MRRQAHFLSNKLVLVKENITELSWLLASFTAAAGGSKAADTRSHEASLAATWQS